MQMENMVFFIDLPRLPEGQRTTSKEMTFFGTELIYYLEAMGLEQSIIDSMYNFDFTPTKGLAFVHTIGGAHSGESSQRTGYCGLGRAVRKLGLATDKPLDIDFVTSSVGSLSDEFLAIMYLAAQGDDGFTEYCWRNPPVASRKKKIPQEDPQTKDGLRDRLRSLLRRNFHVYYPTHDTVKDSTARSAGTICFRSKWYNSPTFPREILRDCKSVRPGMLMHNKVWFNCRSLYFDMKANAISYCSCDGKTIYPNPGPTSDQPTVRRAHGASCPRIGQRKNPSSIAAIGNAGYLCARVGVLPVARVVV